MHIVEEEESDNREYKINVRNHSTGYFETFEDAFSIFWFNDLIPTHFWREAEIIIRTRGMKVNGFETESVSNRPLHLFLAEQHPNELDAINYTFPLEMEPEMEVNWSEEGF
jgi:hypothetical protein